MSENVRSAVIAGVIAAVIWTVISLIASGSSAGTWIGTLIFFAGTAVVTYVIATFIGNQAARRRG